MKPAEDGDCDDAPTCLRRTRNRLLVREPSMRAWLVVEAGVLGHDPSKRFLAYDQDVVEQLPPQGADEALRENVHVWRPRCGSNSACANGFESRREPPSKLCVPIADEQLRGVVHRRVPSLLRAP